MRKRLSLVGVGVILAICLGAAAGASAATEVGDTCAAEVLGYGTVDTFFSLVPSEATVTTPGVITSWGMNIGATAPEGFKDPLTFKILRPNMTTLTAQVTGEDSETVVAGSNKFSVRIPVQAGDVVGMANGDGKLLIACADKSPGLTIGAGEGDPPTGSTFSFKEFPNAEARIPIFATVEPDADGDGYGDETQDQCPTDASTQGPCPAKVTPPPLPPAPPTALSVSAAAKKTFLTVSLTSTAQTSVTVTGTVKIGKGKSVKLKGNTQTVAPGALAKFTVLFPAEMKAALKKLPTNKKLTVSLSASAPGATTKTLAVKVPGQEKVRHHAGSKA